MFKLASDWGASEMKGRTRGYLGLATSMGPGPRCLVFLQGCPLRCSYCNNPGSWDPLAGEETEVAALVAQIDHLRLYIQETGGVTLTGGEPLLQADFTAELLAALKAAGYHTALDTSGYGDPEKIPLVLAHTDLVIADLKFTDPDLFRTHCGGELAAVYDFLDETARLDIPLWIRQVILPGINDTAQDVLQLKAAAEAYPNLEKIDLLPFEKKGLSRYEGLDLPFGAQEMPACSKERIAELSTYLTDK